MKHIKSSTSPRWQLHQTLLLAILLLGLAIRFHGLVWTLPWHFFGDETRIIQNGITVQQMGVQSYVSDIANMSNYPPYRSWEIAAVRALSLGFFGEAETQSSFLVLFGRMNSLFYALLTCVFLYKLGYRVARNPYAGLAAALFFAVWPETILFGQRTLADGAGFMFFTLSAWLAVVAYQDRAYRYLAAAFIAGILAGLGKYNYLPVLMLPALVSLSFLVQRPRQLLTRVILPAGLLALPILYFAAQTVSADDLYYNYLNETAQLENALRYSLSNGFTQQDPELRILYQRYPLTTALRLEANYQTFLDFFSASGLALVLFGGALVIFRRDSAYDRRSLFALALCSLTVIISFSVFRVVEGRQLFSAMAPLLIFWGIGIRELGRYSPLGALIVLTVLAFPMGSEAWTQNNELVKPDTRVETVKWFLDHAHTGTGIAVENEPYEFWASNGYEAEQQFNVVRTYRLFEHEPPTWENMGFYYLVADESYAWRGGYYAGHEHQAAWDAYIEVVARFEGDTYTGPDRMILRVFKPDTKVDQAFGDILRLYGYTVEEEAQQAGDTLAIKYFWWALQPDGQDYIVFNHLIDLASGDLIAQTDRLVGHNGTHPSSRWLPHEWLFDHFSFEIPADTPPGNYRLQIGVYNAADGERLPLTGSSDGILPLLTIEIE